MDTYSVVFQDKIGSYFTLRQVPEGGYSAGAYWIYRVRTNQKQLLPIHSGTDAASLDDIMIMTLSDVQVSMPNIYALIEMVTHLDAFGNAGNLNVTPDLLATLHNSFGATCDKFWEHLELAFSDKGYLEIPKESRDV